MALLNKYRYHNHHRDYPPAKRGHPGLDPGAFGSLKKQQPSFCFGSSKQVQDNGFYIYNYLTMSRRLSIFV